MNNFGKQALLEKANYDRNQYEAGYKAGVQQMQTVNAVIVVRCKDCEYGVVDNPDFPNQYFCEFDGNRWNDGEFYCAEGKRKR